MSPPYDIDCNVCRDYPGTHECSHTGYSVCSSCLEKNDVNSAICINSKAFINLKKMINTGSLSLTAELGMSLNVTGEKEGREIKKEFLYNNEKKMTCFGTTGSGSCRHYIYRHSNGVIYTFCLGEFTDNITRLKKYVRSTDFPRDFGFELV